MRNEECSFGWISAVMVLAMAGLACNLQLSPPAPLPTATLSNVLPPLSSTATATETTMGTTTSTEAVPTEASPTLSPPATGTVAAAELVTVTASGGRLNVRRGPGAEYDTVAAFLKGQSSTATARNSEATWIYIAAPNSTRALGWITATTQYTTVSGNIASLPVMSVAPAAPAYIRNCTGHEMLVSPGGAVLLARGNAPENTMQFFPGEYSITDTDTESNVADVTVTEGKTVDIKRDGLGKSYVCQ